MTAWEQTTRIRQAIQRRTGLDIGQDDAATLRRAEKTLHRWAKLECGHSNNYRSWSIERDETTGKPFQCVYMRSGRSWREPIADIEAGALKRVAAVCKRHGLHFYHQDDPRGCALYVHGEPMTDNAYSRGVAIAA